MGMWLKLATTALSIFNNALAYFRTKQDQDAGAAKQRDADNAKTMDVLKDVGAPVSRSESDQLWNRNKAKFGPDGQAGG